MNRNQKKQKKKFMIMNMYMKHKNMVTGLRNKTNMIGEECLKKKRKDQPKTLSKAMKEWKDLESYRKHNEKVIKQTQNMTKKEILQ